MYFFFALHLNSHKLGNPNNCWAALNKRSFKLRFFKYIITYGLDNKLSIILDRIIKKLKIIDLFFMLKLKSCVSRFL